MGRANGVNGPFVSQVDFPQSVSINIPGQLAAGVSMRPSRRLWFVVEATHVRYSELGQAVTPVIAHDLVTDKDFRIADGTEVHAGGELALGGERTPVFVRAGLLSVPNHRLEFVGNVQPGGTITAAAAQRANAIERSVFNLGPHDDDVRGTFGGGIAVGRHASIDMAYVWKRQLLLSLGLGL
jgi:hypothetical protein